MKLNRREVILINVVITLVGVIVVFIGTIAGVPILSTLLEAIGTGLIATGGVNFLDRLLAERPQTDGVIMVAGTRRSLDLNIHVRKYRADKVDILGMSLSDCLREIADNPNQTMINPMVNRVLFNNTRLRLLFVHPDSEYVSQRAMEDNTGDETELRERQKQSVEYCILFYKRLAEHYQVALENKVIDKPRGSVQIKLLEFCPYMTIERYDNDIYWGLYTSDIAGINAPMFLTNRDENYLLYDRLKNHFVGLLNKNLRSNNHSSKDYFLVKMELGMPLLNRELAESILGEKRLKTLLE